MNQNASEKFDISNIDDYYLPPGIVSALKAGAAGKDKAEMFLKKAAGADSLIDRADIFVLFDKPDFFLDKIADENYDGLVSIIKEPDKNKKAISVIRALNLLDENYLYGPAGYGIKKICSPGHKFKNEDIDFLNEISGNLFTASKIFSATLFFFFAFMFSVGLFFIVTGGPSADEVIKAYITFLVLGAVMMKLIYYLDLFDAVMKSFVLGALNFSLYASFAYVCGASRFFGRDHFYTGYFEYCNPLILPVFALFSVIFMTAWIKESTDMTAPARVERICRSFGRMAVKKDAAVN